MADDELLDQTLDTGATDTPVTQPAEPSVPATPAKPPSVRETLKASIAAVNAKTAAKQSSAGESPLPSAAATAKGDPQAKLAGDKSPQGERGPDGKFLKPGDKPGAKPLEGAQTGAAVKGAAPGTWRTEAKAKWETTDPLVKAEVLRREDDFTKNTAKLQQEISQINNAYTPIEQVIGPRRALWRAQHGSEGAALTKLLNVSDLATQQPNDFLAMYLSDPNVASRVDMQKISGSQGGQGAAQANPQVQAMQQKITGLEQQLSGFLNTHQTQQLQSTEAQIRSFAEATDDQGTPLRPHWGALSADIFNIIPSLKAQFPGITPDQLLDKAYKIASFTNGDVSQEVEQQNEQRIRSQIEAQERAKKAQLANKSLPVGGPAPGSPGNGAAGNAKDLRAELKRNLKAYKDGSLARV